MFLPIIATSIILGKSFDLNRLQVLKPVFQLTDTNLLEIHNTYTRSEYKLVESSADANDFLDVQGELALKIKKGSFDVSGSGKYLKETVDRTKTVELLLTMTFENYTKTFPTNSKQVDNWYRNKGRATHFIRSIVYGGQLVITYRLKSESSKDLEDIKAVVKASLETSGSVNLNVQGKFNQIHNAVAEKSQVEIKAFYTGRLEKYLSPPQDLEGVFRLIDNYPKLLIEPAPIRFEVVSLSTLRPNDFPKSRKHNVVNQILDAANDKYDDVRVALSKSSEMYQIRDVEPSVTERWQKFVGQVKAAKEKLEAAIRRLDLSKPFNPSLFDVAFAEYAKGGYNVPNRFTREIADILNEARKYKPRWYPYTRAVNEYVHWGNTTCSLPSPEPIFVGYAMGAPRGFGSGSDVLCVGPDPELVRAGAATPPEKTADVSGLAYQDTSTSVGELVCARCQLENATSVFTVPAKARCPEGAKLEYEGYLATGGEAVTDPICVDGHPVDRHPDYPEWHAGNSPDVNVIRPLWIKCPGSECDQPENYVRCVVCSR